MKCVFLRLRIFSAGLLACVIVFACSAADKKSEGVRVTIHQADLKENPTRITKTAAKGDKLVVRLELKATGYTWKLIRHDPKRLKQTGEVTTETQDNKPGASEYKVFRFEVLDEGDVDFQLLRPFGNPQAKALKLSIKVKQ